MEDRFLDIIERCLKRRPVPQEDCEYLLSFAEDSEESGYLIDRADGYIRARCDNIGEIGVQIGVIVGPCYVDCGFCNFARSTTDIEDFTMSDDELIRYLRSVTEDGIVSSVSLMTIHNFDFDEFLRCVKTARSALPEYVKICSNTGDLEPYEARELKATGVSTAYHAIRLGESIDNQLEPIGRSRTIKNLIDARIEVATGVEPIGPEHSVREICSSYYDAIISGCHCCSASPRVPVPGTRMYNSGSISDRRLKQIRSALIMCSSSYDNTEFGFYGGFYGGINRFYGEYSNSPKDTEELSEKGMNHTVGWARDQLVRNGFNYIRMADGSIGCLRRTACSLR